jgi:hypothetical protein
MSKMPIALLLALIPCAASANGFDPEMFRSWVDMRTGGDGEPVYWYAVGEVYEYPSGKLLMTVEGIDTARTLWDEADANTAYQLSRKTFVYRDSETGDVLREYAGNPVQQIEYPYQFITYQLREDRLQTFVEQGAGKMKQRIGPGEDIRARRVGDGVLFSAPLFLDMEIPGAGRYQAFEHYDFMVEPGSDVTPQCSWVRYGDLPPWAGGGPSIMHMVTWRIDNYADLPESMRSYLESDARLWMEPPRDLAEIRRLQQ